MGIEVLETPGWHTICSGCRPSHPYQDLVLIGWEDSLIRIQQFYFYHNYIVGYGGYSSIPDYYFIFNEETENLNYFTDKSSWQKSIDRNKLRPTYTRWFDVSYQPIPFLAIIISILSLPCFIILLVILFTQIIQMNMSFKFYVLYGVIVGTSISVLILTVVYRSYLQSL